jgi:predicted flap endonuclease-1-like 5' DNA nuclease
MERHNLSTVWYRALPLWEEHSTQVPQRKSFTSKIQKVCEERFDSTREEMGIYAKPRATMYFKGQRTPVSFSKIEELADNGTDIIFIEKDDVVDLLTEYADKYGIALVDTQGFFTDYGKKLVAAAAESGANTAVLSDYDASGIKLAHDAGDIPRLGVDKDMIDYFGLNTDDKRLTIPHRPKIDVMTRIKGMVTEKEFNWLKHKKIEIDAVIAQVGNKRFWEYLTKKLQDHYPSRDYNRVIQTAPDPSSFYPQSIKDINSSLQTYINLILDDEEKKMESELKDYDGFIENIVDKEIANNERYRAIVEKDGILNELDKKFTTEIKPLMDKLNDSINKIKNEKLQRQQEEKQKEEQRKEQQHHQDQQRKFELKQKFVDIVFKYNLEVQDIEGVGPTTARLLKEKGLNSVLDIAISSVDELKDTLNCSEETALSFIDAAKKLIDEHTE